jgi:hypothetical protein
VAVRPLDQEYETGRQDAANFKQTINIVFDAVLPKWNQTALPAPN